MFELLFRALWGFILLPLIIGCYHFHRRKVLKKKERLEKLNPNNEKEYLKARSWLQANLIKNKDHIQFKSIMWIVFVAYFIFTCICLFYYAYGYVPKSLEIIKEDGNIVKETNQTVINLKRIGFVLSAYKMTIEYPLLKSLDGLEKFAYIVNVLFATLISSSLVLTVLSGIFPSVLNRVRVFFSRCTKCDVLLGMENVKTYNSNGRRVIVWLDKANAEDISELQKLGKMYIAKPFVNQSLKRFFRLRKETHIIVFSSDSDSIMHVSVFEDVIRNRKRGANNYFFHIELSSETRLATQDWLEKNTNTGSKLEYNEFNEAYCKELVSQFERPDNKIENDINILNKAKYNDEEKKKAFLAVSQHIEEVVQEKLKAKESEFFYNPASQISCFNRYECIALNMAVNHPISINMPHDFIDSNRAIVKDEVNIKVVYIGFGRVAKELYQVQVMNNQMPSIYEENSTYYLKSKKIEYLAFDTAKYNQTSNDDVSVDDSNSVVYRNRMKEFKEEFHTSDQTGESKSVKKPGTDLEYFLLKDNEIPNLVLESLDVNSKEFFQRIKAMIPGEKDYIEFVVSLEKDKTNLDYAYKLDTFLRENNALEGHYRIFVREKNYSYENYKYFSDFSAFIDENNTKYFTDKNKPIDSLKTTVEDMKKMDSLSKRLCFFGADVEYLTHESIVQSKLESFAKRTNMLYSLEENAKGFIESSNYGLSEYYRLLLDENQKPKWFDEVMNAKWEAMDYFTQKSNIYTAASVNQKLGLMGYVVDSASKQENRIKDLVKYKWQFTNCTLNDYAFFEKGTDLALNKEMRSIYSLDDDKLSLNNKKYKFISRIIAFQEHLRWDTFHILNGFIPQPITNHKKNLDLRLHNCLIPFVNLYDTAMLKQKDDILNNILNELKSRTIATSFNSLVGVYQESCCSNLKDLLNGFIIKLPANEEELLRLTNDILNNFNLDEVLVEIDSLKEIIDVNERKVAVECCDSLKEKLRSMFSVTNRNNKYSYDYINLNVVIDYYSSLSDENVKLVSLNDSK